MDDRDFRAYYLRNTSLLVGTLFITGLCSQLFLSTMWAPFGSKSRLINAIYIGTTILSLHNVHGASTSEQLSRQVGVPTSALFCCTRVLRMWTIRSGPPADAAAWLNLGRGDWGAGLKSLTAILLGMVLTMISAGMTLHARLVLILLPEALRILLLLIAARKACDGQFQRRIWSSAGKQIAVGIPAFIAGIALSWLHETTIWRMWRRMQSLEACASSQSLVDQQCLLSLFADSL